MSIGIRVAVLAALVSIMAFGAQPAFADDESQALGVVGSSESPGEVLPELAPQENTLVVVVAGSSTDDVLKTNGCTNGRPASLWTYSEGSMISYSPSADADARAPWESLFSGGIPAFTTIGVACW